MPHNKRQRQQLIDRRARKAAKRRDLAKSRCAGKHTPPKSSRAAAFDLRSFLGFNHVGL